MKKNKIDNEFPTVDIDAIMFYDGHNVIIKRLVTNEMPIQLSLALVKAINDTIKDYYDKLHKKYQSGNIG